MKFYLIVSKGKRRGYPIPIDVDLFVIGTGTTCQLRAHHEALGEQHAALVNRGRKVFIRDLGSGKATKVNGSELPSSEEWPLHKGDSIAVGPLEFRVNFSERQLSQRDLEEWALKALDEDHGPRKSAMDEFDAAMQAGDRDYDDAASAAAAILGKASAMKGVVRGRLRITRDGAITIVRLNDIYLVDPAELSHLKKELQENLTSTNMKVLLDLKNVKRMSSAAVQLFAELSTWLKTKGSTMAMCRMRAELSSVVSDLRNLFNLRVFDDKEKAIAAKW
jgi:anti-anti-sigma regulatory factor